MRPTGKMEVKKDAPLTFSYMSGQSNDVHTILFVSWSMLLLV